MNREMREVAIRWDALEDAFENNARELASYLHLTSGEVIRIATEENNTPDLEGQDDYLRVDPVSSREQYRWMEHFIENAPPSPLRLELQRAIDGKGAFRRFKDVLLPHPIEREQWFSFRSERLRACMEAWLEANRIRPAPEPAWPIPQPQPPSVPALAPAHTGGRARLHALVDALPRSQLAAACAFIEFLATRSFPAPTEASESEAPQALSDEP